MSLSYVDFHECNLVGANFESSILESVEISNTTCNEAVFTNAAINYCYFRKVDLTSANLTNVDLWGSTFTNPIIWENCNLTGCYYGEKDGNKVLISKPPIIINPKDANGYKLYPIYFFDEYIKIGCQIHSLKKWLAWNEDLAHEISGEQGCFIFHELRDQIIATAKAHGIEE
jgi:hypothetical protein